jgi:2-oxoglutarate ferredoxin oxidoreductase subunit alpha
MQDKRMRKLDGLLAEALPPDYYGPADAAHLLICWGSTYGPCREAVDLMNAAGGRAAMLHFSQVWPLDANAIHAAAGHRFRVTCVECNQTGQFASLLRRVGALGECELLSKYDGLAFTGEEIVRRLAS